ncbi:Protein boule [Zootermopsis nevadensis]|uniref:Protein boule n=1 Tax=Zootermopsis nevadensis TaxID=136037 RepID=A0A067RLH6_ZOONE|nr:Protein boule [Zootermopsis nevadensis]
MATLISKKNKSSASTCTTEGSTTSSSPASSVNLITTNSSISQPQHNIVANNNNNAPKYGTLIPNRIFVGGISGSTTESELFELFSAYGTVRAAKVISDRAGVSKGYGFVTFETEDEARRPMRDSECIILKDRKLNIAPAIKKQPFSQTYEAASPPTVHSNTIFYQNGVPYTFHNGVAYFPATPTHHAPASAITTTGDPVGMYQTTYVPPPATPTHSPGAAAAYPVIYPCAAPPTMYVTPQQFQYQPMPPPVPPSQYIYTASASSTTAAAPGNGPPVTQGSPMLGAPAPLPPAQHYYTQAHLNPTDLYYSIPQPYPTMMSNEGVVYDTSPQTETSSNQSAEVQFYSGAGNSACHQTYHPTSSGSQQQMAVPPRRFASSSRRSGNSDGGSSGKYSKNVVNSVQVLAAGASKVMGNVDEGAVGGAGDAPTRLPLPNCVVMQEACHQVQALSL